MVVRALVGLLIGLIVPGLVAAVTTLEAPEVQLDFLSFVMLLESGINDAVLISIAVFSALLGTAIHESTCAQGY